MRVQELAWQLSREMGQQQQQQQRVRVAPPASMPPGTEQVSHPESSSPLSGSTGRDALPVAAASSRGRPTTARLRQLKASLAAKKREANTKAMSMRRGRGMRGGKNGLLLEGDEKEDGALLIGGQGGTEEVSPAGGLAGGVPAPPLAVSCLHGKDRASMEASETSASARGGGGIMFFLFRAWVCDGSNSRNLVFEVFTIVVVFARGSKPAAG